MFGFRMARIMLFALMLTALLTGIECGGTDGKAEPCEDEGLQVCSDNGNAIWICEEGEFIPLESCGAQMECQEGADGPQCVPATVEMPLQAQVACANDALTDFNAYLNALIHLLKKVDNPSYRLPPGIFLDWGAGGEFGAQVDAGVDGVLEDLAGFVRPAEDCDDGMSQREVCIFEWSVTRGLSVEEIAAGAMTSNIITGSNATTYGIIDRSPDDGNPNNGNPEIIHSDNCSIEITAFNMKWFLSSDEMYTLQLDFTTSYADGASTSTLQGAVIWAADAGEVFYWTSGDDTIATVTFGTPSGNLDCDFSLRTFEVSCDI